MIGADLAELLHRTDRRGDARVQRTGYECGVFQMLRDKLRCKEIWVAGADRWRETRSPAGLGSCLARVAAVLIGRIPVRRAGSRAAAGVRLGPGAALRRPTAG